MKGLFKAAKTAAFAGASSQKHDPVDVVKPSKRPKEAVVGAPISIKTSSHSKHSNEAQVEADLQYATGNAHKQPLLVTRELYKAGWSEMS